MNKKIMKNLSFNSQLTLISCVFLLLSFSQITYAGERFTKISSAGIELSDDAVEWSCVKHNVTGQIWEVKTLANKDERGNYDTMSNYPTDVNSQALCGFTDWRVPEIKELNSITDKTKFNPAIDTTYFPNISTNFIAYWSATLSAERSSNAWRVNFTYGMSSPDDKGFSGAVRLVRGEPYFESFNYTKLDSTGNDLPVEAVNWSCVRENVSGFIWEVKTTNNQEVTYTFDTASNYSAQVNSQVLCGYNDWRVPEIEELMSIVDYDTYSPAIKIPYFPNTGGTSSWSEHWSASSNVNDSDEAWMVDFFDGFSNPFAEAKSQTKYVRLVRTEQPSFSFPAIYYLLF